MPELLPALSERRARRAFLDTPIAPELEQLFWKAVSVAPSHGNSQPVRILVARSQEVREKLIAALSQGNRHWAPAAPLLFAFAALPGDEAPMIASDGTERVVWPFNAGIAAGSLMAQATALGINAHPMAGFDEAAVRDVFGAPDTVRIVAVFAAGYPGSPDTLPEDLRIKETAPQDRLPLENIVATDRWNPILGISARDWRKEQGRS